MRSGFSSSAVSNLMNFKSWSINDDGQFCGTKWYPNVLIADLLLFGAPIDEVVPFLEFAAWIDPVFWNNGLPDATRDVRVMATKPLLQPRISRTDSECKSLDLSPGAQFDILDGGVLTVVGEND